MKPLLDYLKAVREELTHVTWPTRSQATLYTILVIVISVGISLILGGFDFLFTLGLEQLIHLKG